MRMAFRAAPALALAAIGLAASPGPAAAASGHAVGHVYTETNSAAGNSVAVFDRASDGTLSSAGSVPTGGTGTGAGLGSQGAIALRGDLLFAVNAGSNDVSVLRARRGGGLSLLDRVPSGGTDPISLTLRGRLLYVLNNGGAGNISGFVIGRDGDLTPLSDSTRPLAGSGPAQVSFTPDGGRLIVTEKSSSTIDSYDVGPDGRPSQPASHASSGAVPFGFDFDRRGDLIVSEAAGGPGGTSAVSSYDVGGGAFTPISSSVPNGQQAACWVLVSHNGRFAFTANTGSGTVSSYGVRPDGSVALLAGAAQTVGGAPIDMAQPTGGRFLYTLTSGTIAGARQEGDGGLTPLNDVSGLPASAVGITAS